MPGSESSSASSSESSSSSESAGFWSGLEVPLSLLLSFSISGASCLCFVERCERVRA